MHKKTFIVLLLITATAVESCNNSDDNRIALPVCACIVRGTGWTKDPNPPKDAAIAPGEGGYWIHSADEALSNRVNQIVYDANDNVWIPGADIAMVPQIDKRDGYIKVIDDPDISDGKYGDIEGTPAGGELVASKCRDAWGSSLTPDGLVLIICRNIINNDGSIIGDGGYAEPYDAVLARNGGADLCSVPRNNITRNDVKGRYIVIQDPTLLNPDGRNGKAYVFLAHEFGHVLMLGHGDGLDNDNNGTLPPNNGPRLFDEYCDLNEYKNYDLVSNTRSLMSPVAGNTTNITELQKELARKVAILLPGAVGPQ